jgi:hypothetical protein
MTSLTKTIDVYTLENLSLKSYWALDQLTTTSQDRFSSPVIAKFLIEQIGINTSRQAIEYALKKDSEACNKNKHGFKLMQKGKDMLLNLNKLIFIDAGKPFLAKNITLKGMLGVNHKELSVCDPYVDLGTLDVIYNNFSKGIPIRIITATIIDKPKGNFKRQLMDLNKEGFNIEVRAYSKSVLHDRYIMSEKHFWLSGNSLNYIGNKESFIIQLGADIQQSMTATFNSRWKVSLPI